MRVGERAQSAPLGVLLLIVTTLIGATVVVTVGSAGLADVTESSQLQRAEQSMALFDSQATQVGLGDAEVQRVNFGAGAGTYSVDPTAGEISIVQLDCDDDGIDQDGDDTAGGADGDPLTTDDDAYILPPTDFGAVTYETGDRTIAYEGGGVWQRSGESVEMLSAPSAHYRDSTLTFPVVVTRGSGAASGTATAAVTAPTDPKTVFADPAADFPSRCWEDGTAEPFVNPVTDGTVVVRVESEYARAWGRYFERRTAGTVSYPTDGVVTVELASTPTNGPFEMPGDGGAVTMAGTSGAHATERLDVRLRPDDPDATTFDDLRWSLYAEAGEKELELHLTKGASGSCASPGLTVDATVYYSADGGSTYQGWHRDDAFDAACADLDGDGDDEMYVDVEFVDDEDDDGDYTELESDDPELVYGSLSADDTGYYTASGTLATAPTFDGHGDWESESYATGDAESIDRLVTHYVAELPAAFDLTVDDDGADTVGETASHGEVAVAGSGREITYLHVVTSEIEVEIED